MDSRKDTLELLEQTIRRIQKAQKRLKKAEADALMPEFAGDLRDAGDAAREMVRRLDQMAPHPAPDRE